MFLSCELFLHLTCIPYLKIVKFVCFFVKCRRNVLQWLAKPKIHVLGLVAEKRPGTRHRNLPKSRVWFCLARGVPKNFHHLLRETRKFRDIAQLDVVVIRVSLCAAFFHGWWNICRKHTHIYRLSKDLMVDSFTLSVMKMPWRGQRWLQGNHREGIWRKGWCVLPIWD